MTTRIVILGGGSAGLTAAFELQKKQPPQSASITLVDQSPYFTYQPFLPEVAGGHIAPRDVTVPLRKALRKAKVVEAAVTGLDSTAKKVSVEAADGETFDIAYDQLIVALGAVTRTFPTPGLAENGVGFKSVEEAQYVRDRILGNIAKRRASKTAPRVASSSPPCSWVAATRASRRWPNWTMRPRPPSTRSRTSRATNCASCWSRRSTGSLPRSAPSCRSGPSDSCVRAGHRHPSQDHHAVVHRR